MNCQVVSYWFFGSQVALLVVILGVLPWLAVRVGKTLGERQEAPPLKGLNLPQGSVRSMLALAIVGTYLNVLVFGGSIIGEHYDTVLAAFSALTGSVLGFYFGSRKSVPGATLDDSQSRWSLAQPRS